MKATLFFIVVMASLMVGTVTSQSEGCTKSETRLITGIEYFKTYYSCGSWWWRRRCSQSRSRYVSKYVTILNCCDGWKGPNCSVPACSPECVNGGNCTSPNNCTCPTWWTGQSCETPTCLAEGLCLHGNWTAEEKCVCNRGWNGTSCDFPLCHPPCQNGGNCIAPDTCDCANGWTGPTCSIPICPIEN